MILVFGKTGQISSELQKFDDVRCLPRHEVDLLNPKACADSIMSHRPDAVINAAAYTSVDEIEENEALALIINGEAPICMAEACYNLSIPFVQISTDYVFDGSGQRPWSANDLPQPINAYGRTKLIAEQGIRKSGAVHAILRTSWVFSDKGANFMKTMLRLSEDHDEISVVSDQIGGPTPANDIALASYKIAHSLIVNPDRAGTYHYSGFPNVSWAKFSKEIFRQAGRSTLVHPILSSDYSTRAKRPMNSKLDCKEIDIVFGIKRPNWRKGLHAMLKRLEVT